VNIEKDVGTEAVTGRKSSIAGTALQLSTTDTPAQRGILVKADSANTVDLYVGDADTITADAADATDGWPLAPGEAVLIPIDNLNKIYAVTGGTSSKAWYLVQ
jgi:hypothetical protein